MNKNKIIEDLFKDFPNEMETLFWEIKADFKPWDLEDYLQPHQIDSNGKCSIKDVIFVLQEYVKKENGLVLPKMGSHWVALTTKNMQEDIRAEMINLNIVEKCELIQKTANLFVLEKDDDKKPGLVVYFFAHHNQRVVPHFYFVE